MDDEEFVPRKSRDSASLAPKRPAKQTDSQGSSKSLFSESLFSKAKESPDDSFGLSALSPSKENDKCCVCGKILSHLNEQRRLLHVNDCLDRQETKEKRATAAEKHKNTIDCPICRKPLPPGPYRAAHAKTCGKEHTVSGKTLLEMMDVQSKAAAVRKSKNLTHTSAPVPNVKATAAPKLKGQPRSLNDEQMQLAVALSASCNSPPPTIEQLRENTPQFTRVEDPNEKRKKRPRSFAVVEFAPRTCQCQVLTAIHTRFVDAFKVACRVPKEEKENLSQRTDSQAVYQRKMAEKTNRFERLSDDLSSLFDKQIGADFHFVCHDGLVPAHKAILLARTRGIQMKEATIRVDQHVGILSLWLRYVYSGRVEWSHDEDDAICALAQKYGPDSLVSIKKAIPEEVEETPVEAPLTIQIESEGLEEEAPQERASSVDSCEDVLLDDDAVAAPREVLEDTINGINYTLGNDGEDPMQGINMSASSVGAADEDDDVVVIDDDEEKGEITPSDSDMLLNDVSFNSPDDVFDQKNDQPLTPSPAIFGKDGSILPRTRSSSTRSTPKEWHMTPINMDTMSESSLSSFVEGRVKEEEEEMEGGEEEKKVASPPFYQPDAGIFDDYVPQDDFYYPPQQQDYFQPDDDFYQPNDDYYQPSPASYSSPIFPKLNGRLQGSSQPTGSSPISTTPKSSTRKRRSASLATPLHREIEADSFDNTPILVPICNDEPGPSGIRKAQPLAHSTPRQPLNKKLRFGSNVKIVKTSAVTPMPDYDRMDDARLKVELAHHGLRPMGRKKALGKLKEIYEELHPVIDPSTPTLRPLAKESLESAPAAVPAKKRSPKKKAAKPPIIPQATPKKTVKSPVKSVPSSPSSYGGDDLGNKTLNESDDEEPPEESMLDDPTALPKNIGEMTTVLLAWLRKPENEELYTHMLSLQPVLIDELHVRMSRADDAVCAIPKRALASILDNLGATFSLPQNFGRRGTGRNKKK